MKSPKKSRNIFTLIFCGKPSARKKAKYLAKICEDLVLRYENHRYKPSCKEAIMGPIRDMIYAAKKEISEEWDESIDYMKVAHSMLANVSFDLLASGSYHIFTGVLNPMSCADNIMDIYKSSMDYAVLIGEIDEETRNKEQHNLLSCISQVG